MWRKTVLNSLYFSGAQGLLKPYLGGVGSILMLHRVLNIKKQPFAPNYHLTASPEFLDRIILKLKGDGYDFISLDEVAERLQSPEKYKDAKPFLSITLDDGYRDNLVNAVPVFRRHEVPYTIYIAPALTDGTVTLWWEDIEHLIASKKKISVSLPNGNQAYDLSTHQKKSQSYGSLVDQLLLEVDQAEQRKIVTQLCKAYGIDATSHVKESLMNWEEINALSKDPLCTIGAHTIHHYALSKLPKEDAKNEIEESRKIIKAKIGKDPIHLAYPYGFSQVADSREFNMAKELGFRTATTTRHGVLYPEHKDHMTALPRVSMNGHHQSLRYVSTLLSGIPTRIKNHGKKLDVA